jgi:metal-responsive CopG/Arc/MetJ family transcriptional regulator
MVRFNVNLSEKLHQEFKLHCVQNKLDMTEVVRKLIQEYLDKGKRSTKKK